MRYIKVVSDCFAIVNDDEVIAVVSKSSETQWRLDTVISCKGETPSYVQLHHALKAGMKLEVI